METSEDMDIKFFDDTAALIYSSVSSTLPQDSKAWFVKTEPTSPVKEHVDEHFINTPELPNALCEVDSKAWFRKTEPTSPVWGTSDVDQDPAVKQLECEPNFTKTEAPLLQHEEESPPGLPNEPCDDSKAWFVKTEPTSPVWGTSDVDQDPAVIKIKYELSFVKTETTLPQRVGEHVKEGPPGLANNQVSESDRCLQNSYCPRTKHLQSDPQIQFASLHNELNTNQCPLNECNTGRKSTLKDHIDSVQRNIRVFQCDNKTNLKEHLENHTDSVHKKISEFKCPYCEYKTNRKEHVKRHIDGLHKKITFHCPQCEFKTRWKGHLKKHIDSVHKKLMDFQCAHCKYKTNSKDVLKRHIDGVHKKITFQCPHCELITHWKSHLKKHIDTVHKKIMAFQCDQCKYKTNQKDDLKRHIDGVHRKIALQCPHCELKTHWKNHLKKHINVVHKKIK